MAKLRNIIASWILLAGSIFNPVYAKDKGLEIIVNSAPYFSEVNDSDCSKYVRLAAEKLSGAKYNGAHAWDFAKANRLVAKIERDISNYESKLVPGKTVISFFNPQSDYRLDDNGKLRNVTHVALYAGEENGEIILFENSRESQRKTTFNHLVKDNGYIPREIIAPKKNLVRIVEGKLDLSYDETTAEYLKKYTPTMEREASNYHKRFNLNVDPNEIKTILILESRNNEKSLKNNPMHPTQELVDMFANGENGSYLIKDLRFLKGKHVEDLTAEENIELGIAGLFYKRAKFEKITVEYGNEMSYTVQKGDNAWDIAQKYGTNTDVIRKYTPENKIKDINHLNEGDVLIFRPSRDEYSICGWRGAADSIKRYNGGGVGGAGDKSYLKKANLVYKHFTGRGMN